MLCAVAHSDASNTSDANPINLIVMKRNSSSFYLLAFCLICASLLCTGACLISVDSGNIQVMPSEHSGTRQDVMDDIDSLCSYYLSEQEKDPTALNYGSFTGRTCHDVHESNLMERYNEAPLAILSYAWNCPQSCYYRDGAVLDAVRLGLLCLCNVQCWTGGFPVGGEVVSGKHASPSGVRLQEYGNTCHQGFLGDAAITTYEVVREWLPMDDQARLDRMFERWFEFMVIEPTNLDDQSLDHKGPLDYSVDQRWKEQIRIPRSELESATRLDLVLAVKKLGHPEAASWEAHIGDVTLEVDTTRINPSNVNPYRQYDSHIPHVPVAVWQIDNVSDILPYGTLSGDDYVFEVVFTPVDNWTSKNAYAVLTSKHDTGSTWTSEDSQEWHETDKHPAMQIWVYGDNTERVGTRILASNQESGRFYCIHKSKRLFEVNNRGLLLSVADKAFEKETSLFADVAKNGILPEPNETIVGATGHSGVTNEVLFGGWSPGYSFLSLYLVGTVADESKDSTLLGILHDAYDSLQYLIYRDVEGYKAMDGATTRTNEGIVLSQSDRNLCALGLMARSDSAALKSVLSAYTRLSPMDYASLPYPLWAQQVDCMPIITLHANMTDGPVGERLPTEREEPFLQNLSETKLLAVKTRDFLYYMSYGNATPSGGCIATKINLATGKQEVRAQGASRYYGRPLFVLTSYDSSSSAWDTEANIQVLSNSYPFSVEFSGVLRRVNQTPTIPYIIRYTFLDDSVDVQRWLNGRPCETWNWSS